MKQIKIVAGLSIVYAIFIFALPRILTATIPCLDSFSNATVEYRDCNLVQISNYYLLYSFAGLITVLFVFALFTKMKLKRELILLGIICASIFIFSYYQFLPKAEELTLETNVYLDTFYEEFAANEEYSAKDY